MPSKAKGRGRRRPQPVRSAPKRSIVYSAGVVFGMVIAIAGVVVVVLGLGVSNQISELSGFGVDLKTTSSGLVLVIAGTGLSALLLIKKPADIELFSPDSRPSGRDRLMWEVPRVAAVVAAVASVALIISVVVS